MRECRHLFNDIDSQLEDAARAKQRLDAERWRDQLRPGAMRLFAARTAKLPWSRGLLKASSRSCIPTISSQNSWATSIACHGGSGRTCSRSPSRFATVGDATVSRGSRDGCTSHSPRTHRTTDRTHVTPDHHNPILRLASAPSRRSAALRPRHAGLAALTGHSVEPRTGFYVMVGQL